MKGEAKLYPVIALMALDYYWQQLDLGGRGTGTNKTLLVLDDIWKDFASLTLTGDSWVVGQLNYLMASGTGRSAGVILLDDAAERTAYLERLGSLIGLPPGINGHNLAMQPVLTTGNGGEVHHFYYTH